ncbi:MAG: carbon storage regulator [Proteobacteria bacterium]|nr:carbon storage regulator [Pseudomonadota bacterium]
MLYLTRKVDETIVVNNNIIIKVVEVRNKKVKLGIEFPPTATVLRGEIYEKIRQGNMAALSSVKELDVELNEE